jgi:hypothetical protein
MQIPLKLNSIDQEHLQELYDSSGVARDELPYTDKFDELWQGFQDRTFKNADREQVFAAMLKYTRSSRNAGTELGNATLSDDQLKTLKAVLSRHGKAGKLLPYSDEFNAARTEFNKLSGTDQGERDFWLSILRLNTSKRRPPTRKKAAAATTQEEPEEDGE